MIDMYFDNDSTFLDEDFNVFSDANSSRFSEFLKKYNNKASDLEDNGFLVFAQKVRGWDM